MPCYHFARFLFCVAHAVTCVPLLNVYIHGDAIIGVQRTNASQSKLAFNRECRGGGMGLDVPRERQTCTVSFFALKVFSACRTKSTSFHEK